MKGDFTRFTHRPEKQYTRVLKQQGRVDLDADWNEQAEIQQYLDRTRAADVIGPVGVPKAEGGFAVSDVASDGSNFTVGAGTIYVDGLRCHLDAPVTYQTQDPAYVPPDLTPPEDGRTDLVYLDVWERHVTALEDPDLREVALGGPDTTTRVQTVCQIHVHPDVGAVDCDDEVGGWPPPPSDATLTTAANQPPDSSDPCVLSPTGGYRGLENRLYRVEVHDDSNSATGPTFKWSRDNGAVVFAVDAFAITGDDTQVQVASLGLDDVLALHVNDWVEVVDDAAELAGQPGTMAQVLDIDAARRVLTLSQPITGYSLAGHPRLRRWDQPSDAIEIVVGDVVALEDGVEVVFGGATFRTGDYWVFAARTATASVEVLTDAPARGITHHYARLALLTWAAEIVDDETGSWTAAITSCAPTFPPLTNICAEDVCFDNGNCQLVDASNVQEALDRLCEANDLRHHNKHLHGWGIVCGLQVQCGPEDSLEAPRRHVTVQDGYAIDCEGNNLIVEEEGAGLVVDVLDGIALLDAETPDAPVLNDNGDGEVCLSLGLGPDRTVAVSVDRYTAPENVLAEWLRGSLWMEFYEACLKPWVDLVRNAFKPPEDQSEQGIFVTSGQKTFTTFLNLLWQLIRTDCGRYIFLSPKEDTILRTCYVMLRAMLQSKTFCAMFDNARPFPDYPFPRHNISTIFGPGLWGPDGFTLGGLHTRLRIHPNGELGYTCGTNGVIHVYDLSKEEMVARVEMPGGEGLIVRDVAFSPQGDRVFAIATLRETDTIFAVADVDGLTHTWRPINVLCDLELTTLATRAGDDRNVYAVGKAQGLYAFNPDNINVNPTPTHAFNAVGHLVIADRLGIAYATAIDLDDGGEVGEEYNHVVGCVLGGDDVTNTMRFSLMANDRAFSGRDDIAVVDDRERPFLFAVADGQGTITGRQLFRFDAANVQGSPVLTGLGEDTDIRLGHVDGSDELLVIYEDCYRIRLVQMDEPFLRDDFNYPVQIAPLGVAYSRRLDRVFGLNVISGTLTSYPAAHLNPPLDGIDLDPQPGSQAFLDALEAYSRGVYEAYLDLLGGFLQYLKDCFCDRLLINCPTCDDDDVIYLGVVSIRNGEVYKVCNFSKRKYVKSFPTVGYWLSAIPIMPVIKKLVTDFCCIALPDLFGNLKAPQRETTAFQVQGSSVRKSAAFIHQTDFSGVIRDLGDRVNLGSQLLGDRVQASVIRPKPKATRQTLIKQSDVRGKTLPEATARMEEARLVIKEVRPYDPKRVGENVAKLAETPLRIPPGTPVIVYEEQGVIKYIAPYKEAQPAPITDERLRPVTDELETLKTTLADTRATLATKDAELATLRKQVEALTAAPAAKDVTTMQTELAELRTFRTEVEAFMRRSR